MEEIKAGNKYKYTEETERFKKMNRFYIAATSVLGCIFIFYLWLKLSCNAISHVTVYGNTALIAVFAIVNTIVYLKNKETRKLKAMATWEICIEYLLIGVQTSATFISYAIIMIFILQIPYYEKKSLNRTAIATLILHLECYHNELTSKKWWKRIIHFIICFYYVSYWWADIYLSIKHR